MNKKPKLLIVENDKLTINFYKVFLSIHFNITLIETVEEFYKILETESEYDAVLMDLSIREAYDGIHLAREFRSLKKRNNCPILAVTSSLLNSIKPEIKNEIFNAGISKILEKPIENKLLLKEILVYIKSHND